MLDSKSHSPQLPQETERPQPLRLFNRALTQLSNFVIQLSIFPTTTLPFVILSVEKKAHARNPSREQSFDQNRRWQALDPSSDGCRPGWAGLRFGRAGFKRCCQWPHMEKHGSADFHGGAVDHCRSLWFACRD